MSNTRPAARRQLTRVREAALWAGRRAPSVTPRRSDSPRHLAYISDAVNVRVGSFDISLW